MGKSLFIVRHAQADWSQTNKDFDRCLTTRGIQDANIVARQLKSSKTTPQIWLSSPAARAWQTANIFAKNLHVETETIQTQLPLYLGSVQAHLSAINQLSDLFDQAIIFGHNPGISELTSYFTGARYIDLDTSTLVEIEFPDASQWLEISIGTGNPKRFLYPHQEFAP